ncbi:DUF6241 domain-containing protein [Mesobacillus zeae]|uniref:Uncharacterized protein n=1 Tax=Mesobacillus zeae TaxID=1917180 RepID=A0A398B0H1_9BACI|nr:DUF6241 domain-containing protein [Mesobacillus zeae]RID81480.1 hypothetical protein D1970_21715 [Mesobacillus zeae]
MNKKFVYAALGLSIIVGSSYVILSSNYTETKSAAIKTASSEPKVSYKVSDEELSQAAKEIGEINDEKMLFTRMMEMTFQKLEWKDHKFQIPGTIVEKRIQMTKGNIQYIKERTKSIEVTENKEHILDKWTTGDFNSIEKDFREIRDSLSPGNDKYNPENGPAKRAEESEKEYIQHFFGDDGLEQHNKQWK